MKYLIFVVALLFASNSLNAEGTTLKCEIGPAQKNFGSTSWLVYSCTDNETIVVVSDTGNPAMPFYFTLFLEKGRYSISGEGTGSKQASNDAYKELIKLTKEDIQKLITETKNGN